MKSFDDYVLLTGGTGLLGQYLIRDLLADGKRLAVVIRGNKLTPQSRLERTMQMWETQLGRQLSRPVCLEGDITQSNLGFDKPTLAWVKEHCGSILHSAASLTFTEFDGEPWRTNVEGTRNVLAVCQAAEIKHMHYISTAYVCGHRHDRVFEDDFDVGQEFRNDYEKSKFEAEKLVRQTEFDHLTVYRPVVITGDSVTGYTSTYHGTYLYMKMAKVLAANTEPDEDGNRHVPVRWGLKGDERRNITAVDWNSAVICRIFSNPAAHDRTFHLAPSEPITMRDAIEYASEFYSITGVEFRGYGTQPDEPLNELERWLWSNVSIYGSYDFMDPEFDSANLQAFAGDIPCPKIDSQNARRLMEYAEQDRWGKRRQPAPSEAPLCVESHLAACVEMAPSDDSDRMDSQLVGLDVRGPGGGQWTLELMHGQLAGFSLGLPLAVLGAATLSISVDDLAAHVNDGKDLCLCMRSDLEHDAEQADVRRVVASAIGGESRLPTG